MVNTEIGNRQLNNKGKGKGTTIRIYSQDGGPNHAFTVRGVSPELVYVIAKQLFKTLASDGRITDFAIEDKQEVN